MSSGDRALYGHELDPELRRALTAPMPPDARDWVEQAVGAPITAQRALLGGTSSAMQLLDTSAAPPLDRVVLRRYVLDWVVREPEIPGNEAVCLRLIGGSGTGVPAPRLVASDPEGPTCGVPMTLMTALPGEPVWRPPDRTGWLRSMAHLAVQIHSAPVSAELSDWHPYAPQSREAPTWSQHSQAWRSAYELWDGTPPTSEHVFLHRDFHPGNILWTGPEITGVVDWVSCCAGPPEADIAHCRANLAIRLGQDWADEFLAVWQELTGKRDYDPYWDLTNVVSFDHHRAEPRLDAFVASAAARL